MAGCAMEVSHDPGLRGTEQRLPRNPSPGTTSQLLYKIPLFTYQMYNMSRYVGVDGLIHALAGYGFTYAPLPGDNSVAPVSTYDYPTVSLRRPGAGTGGTPWDSMYFPNQTNTDPGNVDPLDKAIARSALVDN
jgi:hypothetical protein